MYVLHWVHRVVEGRTGVEVIADDFMVVGQGETSQVATQDHNKNLEALLEQCEECGLRLNSDKIKF